MKKLLIIGFLFFMSAATAQPKVEQQDFQKVLEEILSMLDGKTPLNLKRAVFVVENLYSENTLDYNRYCKQIDSIVIQCKKFIKDINI